MHKSLYLIGFGAFSLFLAACVNVHVYFPVAAAENAADRFVRDVYGQERAPQPETPSDASQSGMQSQTPLFVTVLNWMVTPAQAQQPDINISTPGINQLRNAMSARHEQLEPFYESGAVGMDNNGLIILRDESAVPLKDRNTVRRLVADENRDRDTLYREIARANNHPEWEPDIRRIFASRWVANAPAGWWFRDPQGRWQEK